MSLDYGFGTMTATTLKWINKKGYNKKKKKKIVTGDWSKSNLELYSTLFLSVEPRGEFSEK